MEPVLLPSLTASLLSPTASPVHAAAVMGDAASAPAQSRRVSHRACIICHKAKTRCDGQRPCQRCARLGRAEKCIERPNRKRQCLPADRADSILAKSHHSMPSQLTSSSRAHLRPTQQQHASSDLPRLYLDAPPWSTERNNSHQPATRYVNNSGGAPATGKYMVPGVTTTSTGRRSHDDMQGGLATSLGLASSSSGSDTDETQSNTPTEFSGSRTKESQSHKVTYTWSVSASASSSKMVQPTLHSTMQPFELSDLLTIPPEIKLKASSFGSGAQSAPMLPLPPNLLLNQEMLENFQKEFSEFSMEHVSELPSSSYPPDSSEPKALAVRLIAKPGSESRMTPEISSEGFNFIRRHLHHRVAECADSRHEVFSSPTPVPTAIQSHLPCMILSLDATDKHRHYFYSNEALHLLTGQNHSELEGGFSRYGIPNLISLFTPDSFKDLISVKARLKTWMPTVSTFVKVQNKWGSRVPILLSSHCKWTRDRPGENFHHLKAGDSNPNAFLLEYSPDDSSFETAGVKRSLSSEDPGDHSLDFLASHDS
eukprot:g3163.t1